MLLQSQQNREPHPLQKFECRENSRHDQGLRAKLSNQFPKTWKKANEPILNSQEVHDLMLQIFETAQAVGDWIVRQTANAGISIF